MPTTHLALRPFSRSRSAGILGRANARNRNGRVYPKNLLEREAEIFYAAHVVHGRALGELDHPKPDSPTFRSLNLGNVSHVVLDYFWKDDDLMGYVEVLPTKSGAMLRDLYVAGYQLGMSSRGWATLKEKDGYVSIQDDFELITFDFVSDPSTAGAYLRPLQRRYEKLPPAIDVPATYDAFMRNCPAGEAHLKNAPASSGREAPAAVAAGRAFSPLSPASGGTLVACEGTPDRASPARARGRRRGRRRGRPRTASRGW